MAEDYRARVPRDVVFGGTYQGCYFGTLSHSQVVLVCPVGL